jgi:DNA-binding NtrC family response regulator
VVRGRAGIAVDGHGLTASLDKRVLLIEDDFRLAGMLSEYLGKAGFHVIHAENGTRGLALHDREPVDVVILDLMLRRSATSRARASSATAPHLPDADHPSHSTLTVRHETSQLPMRSLCT